jgi:hypothetical protein
MAFLERKEKKIREQRLLKEQIEEKEYAELRALAAQRPNEGKRVELLDRMVKDIERRKENMRTYERI